MNKLPEDWKDWSADRLEIEISVHNKAYWDRHDPNISDTDYDLLVEALKKQDPESPVLTSMGVTLGNIGDTVVHRSPMLSLDKCYDEPTLLKWADKYNDKYVCSPKIDGVACSLRYRGDGKLVVACTRGDGAKGEDITANVINLPSIPKQIPATGSEIEIRGEIYMPLIEFAKHKDTFANPRNAAAGALKHKEGKRAEELGLVFFAYDVKGLEEDSFSTCLAQAATWGCVPVPNTLLEADELQAAYEGFVHSRSALDYEIDGVCYRLDSISGYAKAGATSHHPRGAIAYKLQGESSSSTLLDVEWNVNREGLLTPVGIVSPIDVSGVTVSRVTLHNWGTVRDKKLSVGAEVEIMRRGGVIPHLEKVITPGTIPIFPPKLCPACPGNCMATRTEGDLVYCENPNSCEPQNAALISHYIDRMEIEGFGPKWLEILTSEGILKSPLDLYSLNKRLLLKLPKVGNKRAQGWIDSVDEHRQVPLNVFLSSLGIMELGRSSSKVVAEVFKTIDKVRSLTVKEIEELPGFAEKSALGIINGLKAKEELIDGLLAEITIESAKEPEMSNGDLPLEGQNFLFTATLASMKRAEAESKIRALGGNIARSVSKNLDVLVVGSAGKAGSKLKKAQSTEGVTIIQEESFLNLIGESG